MFLTYFLVFIILGFFIILLLFFFVFTIESLIYGHDLPTSKQATKILAKIIQKNKPNAKIFYDLGCAHGTLSLRLKKLLPYLEIQGIDNSIIRIFFAKLKSKILRRKINFQKQDIFKVNLNNADIIYTYLWYDIMPVLEKKLQKELKQGSIIITNTSHFQKWQPIKKIITHPKNPNFETLYIYVKK